MKWRRRRMRRTRKPGRRGHQLGRHREEEVEQGPLRVPGERHRAVHVPHREPADREPHVKLHPLDEAADELVVKEQLNLEKGGGVRGEEEKRRIVGVRGEELEKGSLKFIERGEELHLVLPDLVDVSLVGPGGPGPHADLVAAHHARPVLLQARWRRRKIGRRRRRGKEKENEEVKEFEGK
jgi:hypothetical protein